MESLVRWAFDSALMLCMTAASITSFFIAWIARPVWERYKANEGKIKTPAGKSGRKDKAITKIV